MRLLLAALLLCLVSTMAQASFDRHDQRGWSQTVSEVKVAKHHKVRKASRKSNATVRTSTHRERSSSTVVLIESSLLVKARAFLGTNPTGWSRVWCGRFMAMIAPEAAKRIRNPNLARAWAELPHVECRIGVIAVLTRGRGGHVGVVSDCTPRGPRIVSGNHNRKVGEGMYPAGRVLAYVAG